MGYNIYIYTMLDEIKLKNMGLKGKIADKINQPNFIGHGDIWLKDSNIAPPYLTSSGKHPHYFYKYGKSLGMKTKRYI